MPGEERLPEERLRKVGMSESLRRSEEMTQSNIPLHGVRSTFWVPEGVMVVTVPQNEKISENGKNGRKRSRLCYLSEKSK